MKRFTCFFYKCRKCEDLVNVQGDLLEGPRLCTDTIVGALDVVNPGNPAEGRRVYFQRIQLRFPHCRFPPADSYSE